MICPVSSNISNLQEVNLQVGDLADMQRKAARFNQLNPRKRQERMRIIDIILAVKREVCDSAGILDLGFYHDFGDDDISARIRHAGYKLMLCGDTYVYHDHDFRNMEDKDPERFQKSLAIGPEIYPLTTTYETVDLSKNHDFLETIKKNSQGKYFVFDNFHYLSPIVQQQFCSLLKEFNYQGIRIIIVGVWKDASRITARAPDLLNRCAHIDIGTWSNNELREVSSKEAKALNIDIAPEANELFIRCAANNVGIFKDF